MPTNVSSTQDAIIQLTEDAVILLTSPLQVSVAVGEHLRRGRLS